MAGTLRKYKKFVGLDISGGLIKLAVLSFTSGKPYLEDYAVKEKGEEEIAEAIKKLFSEKKLNTENVVCLFSSPGIFIRHIRIPHMAKQELTEAAKWEVKEYLPFSISKANIDFLSIGETEEKGVKKIDGIVAASQDTEIEEYTSLLSNAGIEPVALDILPHALWNGIKGMGLKEGVISIINLGEKETHLSIFREGHLELCRNIPGGVDRFVASLVGEVVSGEGGGVIDNTEAVKITREYGLVQDDAVGMAYDKIPLSKIGILMRPAAENLLTEIGRFFDHFRETHFGDKIGRIVLCGEGSDLKNLSEFLNENLGIPVETASPLKGIGYPSRFIKELETLSPRLTAAIGLALGQGRGINLLPRSVKIEKQKEIKKFSINIIAGVILFILACIYLGLSLQQRNYKRRLSELAIEWDRISPRQMEFIKLTEEKKRLDTAILSFKKMAGRKFLWPGVLKEIGYTIPDNAFLQGISIKMGDITLKGIISRDRIGGHMHVASYMDALENSPFFKNVNLVSSGEDPYYQEAISFELNMELE